MEGGLRTFFRQYVLGCLSQLSHLVGDHAAMAGDRFLLIMLANKAVTAASESRKLPRSSCRWWPTSGRWCDRRSPAGELSAR